MLRGCGLSVEKYKAILAKKTVVSMDIESPNSSKGTNIE